MKPKDLAFPYREGFKPCLMDQVFYLPTLYNQSFDFDLPDWNELFPRKAPLCLEYCSGNGSWLVEKAKAHPESNWIGVEMRFDRIRKIYSKRHNLGLTNLFLVCGEAHSFTKSYLKEGIIDSIYINFPDPWPKRKHEKNRLLSDPFVEEMRRILTPQGSVTFVTDDIPYRDHAVSGLQKAFSPRFPAPYFVNEWEGYGTSFFEELWRSKDKQIHYLQFQKC